jgi:hypothetical protein
MRNKVLLIIVILFFIVGAWLGLRFIIGGPEDTWICDNEQWVKHGNPRDPMPTSGCGVEKEDIEEKEDISEKIKVFKPQANEILSGPIEIGGEARGSWYFEAVFPIWLIDENGEIIAQTSAWAQGEWMTEDFVPFKAEIEVPSDFSGNATLILKNDNPSGLPEYDKEIRVPIKINKKDSSRENGTNLVLIDVPFLAQAPFGQWSDPIYQNACEEASLLMAILWVNGVNSISKEEATLELKKFADFEIEKYNNFYDHSMADTGQLMRDYFGYNNIEYRENIIAEDITNQLLNGNPVIVPINGQVLKNPFYTPPGPAEHMLLIIGYDFITKEFITNDAGTRQGEKYRYDQDVLWDSIRDYPTGYKEPILEIRKVMLVIKK